jgi:hypothetical protein
MLFFTLGLNFVVPQMASQSPAFGMGGGGAPEVFSAEEASPQSDMFATEESAAAEAPPLEAPAATEAPAEPSVQLVPQPTESLSTENSAREMETPSAKDGVVGDATADPVPVTRPVPPTWQIVLAVIALLSALIMVIMRQAAASRWRRR